MGSILAILRKPKFGRLKGNHILSIKMRHTLCKVPDVESKRVYAYL